DRVLRARSPLRGGCAGCGAAARVDAGPAGSRARARGGARVGGGGMSAYVLTHELDDLVLHLKGLVHVRALLEDRGASEEELEAHGDEIKRVRSELARLVRR